MHYQYQINAIIVTLILTTFVSLTLLIFFNKHGYFVWSLDMNSSLDHAINLAGNQHNKVLSFLWIFFAGRYTTVWDERQRWEPTECVSVWPFVSAQRTSRDWKPCSRQTAHPDGKARLMIRLWVCLSICLSSLWICLLCSSEWGTAGDMWGWQTVHARVHVYVCECERLRERGPHRL